VKGDTFFSEGRGIKNLGRPKGGKQSGRPAVNEGQPQDTEAFKANGLNRLAGKRGKLFTSCEVEKKCTEKGQTTESGGEPKR